jgi:hypothetical protein
MPNSSSGHCQTVSEKTKFLEISLEEWLTMADDWFAKSGKYGKSDEMGKYCAYNPHNLMTTLLSGYEPEDTSRERLTVAKHEVTEAGFVGLIEHYALSLCLLSNVLDGVTLEECRCANAGRDSEPQVNTTDNNHGSHSDTVEVSDRARALIERLTREDAQLYEVARARFERDVQKAGLDCWLENEEQLRSELGVRLSEEDI